MRFTKIFRFTKNNIKIINHNLSENNLNIVKAKKIKLNLEQLKASTIINKALFANFHPIVLQGVTGSGKTEVYFEAIEKMLEQKKQVLVMLPEISLTPQFEKRNIYFPYWMEELTVVSPWLCPNLFQNLLDNMLCQKFRFYVPFF